MGFSPTYHVWRQYLELSRTYSEKRTICTRLLAHLTENPNVNRELNSHRLLDALLFLVQLNLYSGRYKTALAELQGALGKRKRHDLEDTHDLTSQLTPSDLCIAWLCYIHAFEFHRLPAPWFDPSCGKPSWMVSKQDFVFPWQPGEGSRAPDDKLLGMFQGTRWFLVLFVICFWHLLLSKMNWTKTLRADFNAVYFRRGLKCILGSTNDLIDGGQPRAKHHIREAKSRFRKRF